MFFWNPCQGKNVHMYATTKELKKKAFVVNGQNIIQATAIGIEVAFMLEIDI